jgi:hypothetical protein
MSGHTRKTAIHLFKQVLAMALMSISVVASDAADAPKQNAGEATSTPLHWAPAPKTPKLGTEMFLVPVQCGRGAPFLRVVSLDANHVPHMDTLVLLGGDDNPVSIDISKATEVKDAHVVSYFATDSDVVVLVTGTDEIRPETRHIVVTPPPGSSQPHREFEETRNSAETHDYILHYDFTGALKSAHKLDASFEVQVVGEFASGQLLLGGMKEDGPQWAIADNDGTIRSFITLPDEGKLLEKSAKSTKLKGFNGPMSPNAIIGLTQIVPFRGSLVIVGTGDDMPLYIVGAGGGVRTLRVKFPSGMEKDYGLSSQTGFYLKGKDKVAGAVREKGQIYRLDMQTGTISQRYSTGNIPVSSVVCADANDFLALHQTKGATTILRGSSN